MLKYDKVGDLVEETDLNDSRFDGVEPAEKEAGFKPAKQFQYKTSRNKMDLEE